MALSISNSAIVAEFIPRQTSVIETDFQQEKPILFRIDPKIPENQIFKEWIEEFQTELEPRRSLLLALAVSPSFRIHPRLGKP
jgi:hypothetical protein